MVKLPGNLITIYSNRPYRTWAQVNPRPLQFTNDEHFGVIPDETICLFIGSKLWENSIIYHLLLWENKAIWVSGVKSIIFVMN